MCTVRRCGAGLDLFRLGSVIGGTVVTGARSEALYQAIEELAGDKSSVELVNKAQAAVSTSKVVLAITSVRKALQARRTAAPWRTRAHRDLQMHISICRLHEYAITRTPLTYHNPWLHDHAVNKAKLMPRCCSPSSTSRSRGGCRTRWRVAASRWAR